MKTRILLLTFLLLTSITGFCATITITASSPTIYSFSPNNGDITIASGDIVSFVLNQMHNAVEVSQATWSTNGITPLPGGFEVDYGGGTVSDLSVGIHYYVCQNHAESGMKGTITVTSLGLPGNRLVASIALFPNPTADLITIKGGESILGSAYSIADESGRQVLTGQLNDTSIDISRLTMGIYFFQIGEERRQSFKIIKK